MWSKGRNFEIGPHLHPCAQDFLSLKNSHAFATSSTYKISLKGLPVPHNLTVLFFLLAAEIFLINAGKKCELFKS